MTALSLIETDEWWIRIWNFPWVQIRVALVIVGDRNEGFLPAVARPIAAVWTVGISVI